MTGGEPLGADVRGFMEPRFNADFQGVRVHRDAEASHLSNRLSARAFTYQNHIFFSRNQYQPDSSDGKQLLAHELTHTIQQGQSIQRTPKVSTSGATPSVQRLGVQDALDKFADWANAIPGFRLLTLIMGVNPINLRTADRSAANLLRALIELIPGGVFITQALDNHGVIAKAATWVEGKLAELGDIGGGLSAALRTFLDSLSWTDIFNLDGVWARAKHIFADPAGRLIQFALSTAGELLKMVKDAILKPLAALAQGTRGYDLLCVLLGEDPISGEPVPRGAENLIGGFMKLIGQEEVWENIKKGNAIARAYAWFQNALGSLMAMVHAIPMKIVGTLEALNFQDIATLAGAFGKIVGTFVNIAVDFVTWGLSTVWELLKIVIDVVKPGLMGYLQRTGDALKSIVQNPMPFLGNLVKAAKLGFTNFADRIGEHLKTGIIDWLTGSLEGVYIPKAGSLIELGKFALSVLGITWAQVRGKIVTALGPRGEKIMQGLELAFDVVKAFVTGGIAAVWDLVKEKLADLKDQVIEGIISFVTDTIVKKAIPKLLGMFIPGAGFIPAIISIYDTIMVFVEKIKKVMEVVTAFVDSIVNIAAGNIGPAAKRVESTLAGLLSLAISFLAGFLGLGKVTDKIMDVVKKVRAKVDAAIGVAVNWVVGKAKALFASLFSGKDSKPDERTPEQKLRDLDLALTEAETLQKKPDTSEEEIREGLPAIKKKYNMQALDLVIDSENEDQETVHMEGSINPAKDKPKITIPKRQRYFSVSGHPADPPNFAKSTKPELKIGESHHVPVKVLVSWFASKLEEAAALADDKDLRKELKKKAKSHRANEEGKELSAIWLQKEVHTFIHRAIPKKLGEKAKVIRTKKGNISVKPGQSTLEHNFPGTVIPTEEDEINPDMDHVEEEFRAAYNQALTMGNSTVSNLRLPTRLPGNEQTQNPVTALTKLAKTSWEPYLDVPKKK
ncbi:DUF4157 domain-containing protein [Paraburkholderia sp. RL17-337-BIB-A]